MSHTFSEVKETLLRAQRLRESRLLPRELVALFVREPDCLLDEMYACLEATVYGQDLEHTLATKMPASWFQHLKESHAPAWCLKRWPVRYTIGVQTIKVARLFPDFVPPKVGEPVVRILHMSPFKWCPQ